MSIAADEDIVRAIFTDKWDGDRIAPSLFAGENVSVSRLAVVPLAEHWDMFRKHFEKPPSAGLNGSAKSVLAAFSESAGTTRSPLI
jgi:hypothetical protein